MKLIFRKEKEEEIRENNIKFSNHPDLHFHGFRSFPEENFGITPTLKI